jgi:hypothetical protein
MGFQLLNDKRPKALIVLNLSPLVAPTSSARSTLLFGFQWVVDTIHTMLL